MEQSRFFQKDATHQLGSFLEMVSKQLTVLNHRPDKAMDTSSTTKQARCMETASGRNSSVNLTSQDYKHCAESVTHIATSYNKSSHSRNHKSLTRKSRRLKNEIQCHPSRTRSVNLHVNDAEETNHNKTKWFSNINIHK